MNTYFQLDVLRNARVNWLKQVCLLRMFERNLVELIKGIRAQKTEEGRATFILSCFREIKEEIRSKKTEVKAVAISKCTYLQMLGYDVSFAAFVAMQLCASDRFSYKTIGYLYIAQVTKPGMEVVTLSNNLFKKEFSGGSQLESSVALTCLARIATEEMADSLMPTLVGMLNSTHPYIRKKAVLTMFKLLLKSQDSLRPVFPRLKEKLSDSDPSVVNATVNVICELAYKNPRNYLILAPVLYNLLSVTTVNWTLIKIVKLFGVLSPYEPRLGKKLVEPLTNIINTTSSTSLMYETIKTCTIGLSLYQPVMMLCLEKLKWLIEDKDQNLKYLGLVGLQEIMLRRPKMVAGQRETILKCLDDSDSSIRIRALDLLAGIVSKTRLKEVVAILLERAKQSTPGAIGTETNKTYREMIVRKIIEISSQQGYKYVTDFRWYIDVLITLIKLPYGTMHGKLLANQLLEIGIRVEGARGLAIERCTQLLVDSNLLQEMKTSAGGSESIQEVLVAAAFICSEYVSHLSSGFEAVIASFIHPRVISLPAQVQAVFIHCATKVFAYLCAALNDESSDIDRTEINSESLTQIRESLTERLELFVSSQHLEVQERACNYLKIIELSKDMPLGSIFTLFEDELKPVNPKAQEKVPIPPGLDLDEPMNPEYEDILKTELSSDETSEEGEDVDAEEQVESVIDAVEGVSRREKAMDPFYLDDSTESSEENQDNIPMVALTSDELNIPAVSIESSPANPKAKDKDAAVYAVNLEDEMPEGVDEPQAQNGEDRGGVPRGEDQFGLSGDIDLSAPLREEEKLQDVKSYYDYIKQDKEKEKKVEEDDKEKKRTRKKHRHRKRDDILAVDEDGEKPSHRRHKHRHHHRKGGSEHKSKSSKREEAESQRSPDDRRTMGKAENNERSRGKGVRMAPSLRPLFEDGRIKIDYVIISSVATRKTALMLQFHNLSSSILSNLSLTFQNTLSCQIIPVQIAGVTIAAGSSHTSNVELIAENFSKSNRIRGQLLYGNESGEQYSPYISLSTQTFDFLSAADVVHGHLKGYPPSVKKARINHGEIASLKEKLKMSGRVTMLKPTTGNLPQEDAILSPGEEVSVHASVSSDGGDIVIIVRRREEYGEVAVYSTKEAICSSLIVELTTRMV